MGSVGFGSVMGFRLFRAKYGALYTQTLLLTGVWSFHGISQTVRLILVSVDTTSFARKEKEHNSTKLG